jgi:serine/threonine protein kinase
MHATQLGPYVISTLLGRGGMGAVYEAVDQGNGRVVAVKTLATHLSDDPGLRKRFACEIETLLSLRHPCIVELLAFGEEDGQPYFAMELVRGRSLEQLLRSGRTYTWRETVDVALAITRALKSAHDHGVIHRDLKPANLLFPDEPWGDATVKLADFGIARLFGSTGHTMSGMIVGTAEYMAPEQAAGAAVDHRVDLYALGLVMFAMLSGRPPFHGGQVTDVIKRQRSEPPPRIASRVADVPPELDDLIDRLLAKDPTKRPASALAVGRQLAVIFTTAHDQYAVKAFEIHAVDYLLKPFDRERLRLALERARTRAAAPRSDDLQTKLAAMLEDMKAGAKQPERIPVKSNGKVTFVRIPDIDWIGSADNYVELHVGTHSHLIRETMNSVATRLPPEQFVRISRTSIVNLSRVKELQPLFHGEYTVTLTSGTRLTLSRSYRDQLPRLGVH